MSCKGFTDKRTGKTWNHSDVLRYIKKLEAKVASLQSASRVLEESRLRVAPTLKQASIQKPSRPASWNLYNDMFIGAELETKQPQIKSASKSKVPSSWSNYRRLIEGT